MGRLKIGAFLSSFRLDMKSALQKANEIGLLGIQFSSIPGEVDVESIDESTGSEIIQMFNDFGLEISSVCGDIGGFAINDESVAKERVERTKRIMDITKMLGSNIVQSHIGHIPADMASESTTILFRSMEEIGRYGDEIGVFFASETGPEPASVLRAFLDKLASPSVKVNYDPANLIMNGFDHIQGVYDLRDYIIHSHAKDARRTPDEHGELEQPLGKGEVDFPRYIKAMNDIGYQGYYVIEREVGENPVEDIIEAKRFLDQF